MHLLLIACLVAGAFATRDCPANSHYNSCGTACPITCENYLNPPKVCVLMCNPGCHCDDGYVKTQDGQCVLPEECSNNAFCGANQEYKECGTACPLTCDNYDNPPRICPAMCVSGCHCQEGYVKTRNGECVRPENCPNRAEEKNCVAEPEFGYCRGKYATYYYDKNEGDCIEGCGQNGNSYATYAECKSACIDTKVWAYDVCRLPFDIGTGYGNTWRWGFNNALGQCTRFQYTGAGGNRNNFKSLSECERVCEKTQHLPSACQQEKKVGLCKAAIPRYFYNHETGECEHFIYGGCGGNSNNFNSKEDCEGVCKA